MPFQIDEQKDILAKTIKRNIRNQRTIFDMKLMSTITNLVREDVDKRREEEFARIIPLEDSIRKAKMVLRTSESSKGAKFEGGMGFPKIRQKGKSQTEDSSFCGDEPSDQETQKGKKAKLTIKNSNGFKMGQVLKKGKIGPLEKYNEENPRGKNQKALGKAMRARDNQGKSTSEKNIKGNDSTWNIKKLNRKKEKAKRRASGMFDVQGEAAQETPESQKLIGLVIKGVLFQRQQTRLSTQDSPNEKINEAAVAMSHLKTSPKEFISPKTETKSPLEQINPEGINETHEEEEEEEENSKEKGAQLENSKEIGEESYKTKGENWRSFRTKTLSPRETIGRFKYSEFFEEAPVNEAGKRSNTQSNMSSFSRTLIQSNSVFGSSEHFKTTPFDQRSKKETGSGKPEYLKRETRKLENIFQSSLHEMRNRLAEMQRKVGIQETDKKAQMDSFLFKSKMSAPVFDYFGKSLSKSSPKFLSPKEGKELRDILAQQEHKSVVKLLIMEEQSQKKEKEKIKSMFTYRDRINHPSSLLEIE